VIAGDRAEGDVDRGVAATSKREIVLDDGSVECDVAGVDDEIRSALRDDPRHRLEVWDEPRLLPAESVSEI
jgi:hypothetical protein